MLRIAAGSGAALLAEASALRQGAASKRPARASAERRSAGSDRAREPARPSPTSRPLYLRPPDAQAAGASGRRGADAGRARMSPAQARTTPRPWRRFTGAASPTAWDEAAMAQFLGSPDVLCLIGSVADEFGRRARRPADRAEGGRRGGTSHAWASRPLAGTPGSAARCCRRPWRALRDSRRQATFPRSRGGQRSRAGALPLARRECRRPDAPGYYGNGADAAIFSLALSTAPQMMAQP